MDTSDKYVQGVERVKEGYQERILAVLGGIKEALEAEGYEVSGPDDMSCEDFRWSLLVYCESNPEDDDLAEGDVDITFTIAESAQYEGSEDGINFMVDVVEVSGRIIGGMCPFNYTSEVWVPLDDSAAIEERFSYFEQADPESMVSLLAEA